MMLSRSLTRFLPPNTPPLAVFPMEAWETWLPEHEGATGHAKERIIVAVLYQAPEDARYRVHFIPGVTGHEVYFMDDAFCEHALALLPKGPKAGIFGPEVNMWALCAGTPGRWAQFSITVEDMQSAIRYFLEVKAAKHPLTKTEE